MTCFSVMLTANGQMPVNRMWNTAGQRPTMKCWFADEQMYTHLQGFLTADWLKMSVKI